MTAFGQTWFVLGGHSHNLSLPQLLLFRENSFQSEAPPFMVQDTTGLSLLPASLFERLLDTSLNCPAIRWSRCFLHLAKVTHISRKSLPETTNSTVFQRCCQECHPLTWGLLWMRMTALNTIIVKAININTDNTTELFLLLETLTAAVSNTSAIFQTDEVSKVNLQSTVLSFHCFFFYL